MDLLQRIIRQRTARVNVNAQSLREPVGSQSNQTRGFRMSLQINDPRIPSSEMLPLMVKQRFHALAGASLRRNKPRFQVASFENRRRQFNLSFQFFL